MTMGKGGVFGDPDMLFGRSVGGLPGMPKRKRGLLGEDDYVLEVSPESQAALDRAAVAPEQKKGLLGFWQGGDKFTARDGIAGLLAGIGDAFDREGGGDGGALDALIGGRAKAFAEAKKQAELERIAGAFRNQGMNEDDIKIAMLNPEAFATKSADRFRERITNKAGDRIEIGPDGNPRTVYQDNTPEILGVPGMGVFAMNRRTGQPYGTGGSEPPPQAIDDLRKNPSMAEQFDQAYGPGASQRYLQGGAGSGPQPFRP